MSKSTTAAPTATDGVRWVGWLIGILVVLDVTLVAINGFGATSFLDLDEERNFPTWYSSAKLLGTAFAALWCWRLAPTVATGGLRRFSWPAVAALFVGLSMDQTATAHERLAAWMMDSPAGSALRDRVLGGDAAKDAFIWPLLLAPVGIVALYVLVGALWSTLRHDRRSLVLGVLGCLGFVAAVVLEVPAVYDSAPIETWGAAEVARYEALTVIEETAEVVATTLMLSALLLHARRLARGGVDPEPEPEAEPGGARSSQA